MIYVARVYRDVTIEAASEQEAEQKVMAMILVSPPKFVAQVTQSIDVEEIEGDSHEKAILCESK